MRAGARPAALALALIAALGALLTILPGRVALSGATTGSSARTLHPCGGPRRARHSAPPLPEAPYRWALGANVALRNMGVRDMCLWAARTAHSGATYVREDFHWADIERRRGRFRWGAQDALVGTAARYGLTVLPLLLGPPRWAGGALLPRDRAAFAAFAARAAARYGPGGVFWRRHRSLPKRPATWFELFNEPYYAAPGYVPDPAEYARVVAAAVPAARAANPRARFLIAGETTYSVDGGRTQRDWIAGMYAAVPAFGSYFDAISAHPYTHRSPLNWGPSVGDHRYQTRRVQEMHDALVAHGDPAKHIWITEIGWSTCGAHPDCVSESSQARYFRDVLHLRQTRFRDYVDAIFGFEYRDHTSRSSVQETSYGIVRRNGSRKPAWYALRAGRPRQ